MLDVIADELEKKEAQLTEVRDALHAAERAKDDKSAELRLAKGREAELAASLETKASELAELRKRLALAEELEARMMQAESGALADRKSAAELERELEVSRQTLRLTGGELDAAQHTVEQLRATVHALESKLAEVTEQLDATRALADGWRNWKKAEAAITAAVKRLKTEDDGS